MSKDGRLQIGGIARKSQTPIDTIRYYEKVGLLPKARRSEGGFRLYTEETVRKLRFIRKAKSLGLGLKEVREIVQCSDEGLKPCCDLVRKLFTKKIAEFEIKIKELEQMKQSLESLLSGWVSAKKLKQDSFAICPQIENEPKKKRH